jgi:hypothetical protein
LSLAAVRNIGSPRALRTAEDVEDFEQEIVDQYALAMAAAGLSDGHVSNTRSVVIEFARSLPGPLWSATCDDADRFLAEQRRAGLSVSTRAGKAGTLAMFFEFVISRYQGDIHALTGFVVEQPIDEFNRQSGASLGKVRVPPSDAEVDELFAKWRLSVPSPASTCRPPATISLHRCGAGWGCGSTRRRCWTSATGGPIWASSASCTSATAKAAGAAAPKGVWFRRSTERTG